MVLEQNQKVGLDPMWIRWVLSKLKKFIKMKVISALNPRVTYLFG